MNIPQHSVPLSNTDLVYERKFDVALRASHSIKVKAMLMDVNTDSTEILFLSHLLVKHNVHRDSFHEIKVNVNIWPHIFQNLITLVPKYNSDLHRMSNIATRCTNIQHQAITSAVQQSLVKGMGSYLDQSWDNILRNNLIKNLFWFHNAMTKLIDKIPITDGRRITREKTINDITILCNLTVSTIKPLGLLISWTRNSCIVTLEGNTYLLPRSYLLMIHNKASDILSVLILSASTPDRIYGCSSLDITTSFLKEFSRLAVFLQDKFFSVSKLLESLVIAESLIRIEGNDNSRFLRSLTTGLMESIEWDYNGSTLQSILREGNTAMMHELACLSKAMGHPFCDMEASAHDMYEKTHEERYINLAAVQESVRLAKQDYITRYLVSNKVWPPVTIGELASESMKMAHAKNVDPTQHSHVSRYGLINRSDWDEIDIGQNETFSRIENFLPFVKDRTVSLCRSKVLRKYLLEQELSQEEKKTQWKETRALLAYLLLPNSETEHLSYLEMYHDSNWEAMEEYLVARLVPKEKEHKTKARCFGCKPIKERARTTILGENAARFLHKHTDSEAMTLSELALSKKLYAFRNTYKSYQGYEQIVICLDASGWNSRLRSASMQPIAREILDPYFGVTFYHQFHDTYSHMLIYLPDVDHVYAWAGQDGGIEGQDTYIWVLSYITHLKTVLNRTGYPYRLVVKGDDARVIIMIPPIVMTTRTLDDVRIQLVEEVTAGAEEFGYLMKPEDCYGSKSYCAFSKNAFIDNVEQPQGFRKCQKAYGANNAFMNTLDSYVASSFSNTHAASRSYPTPIPCYQLALFWHIKALLNDKRYTHLSDVKLTALCLIPNLLGGFPIIFLHNFFQRAESDLLASFCGIVKRSQRVDQELHEVLILSFTQKVLDASDNIEILCQDPYALPLYKPTTAQAVLRSQLRLALERLTENRQIKDLFTAKRSEFQEKLISLLRSCNVYNPRVMCGIYSSSPEGIISELVTKFESGKSMMEAILLKRSRKKGVQVLRQARQADDRAHKFRLAMLNGRIYQGENIYRANIECPYEQAQAMRVRLWKKDIEGVSQPPVYHTVLIGDLDWSYNIPRSDQKHFTCYWDPPVPIKKNGSLFAIGMHTPYIGESTSKGLQNPEVSLTTNNMYALKIAKLLDLYKWTIPRQAPPEGEMSISNLIAQMIFRYTGRPINEYIPFTADRPIGRTTQHHLRANQFRPSIVPNTIQNVYTWCNVDMLTHQVSSDTNTHLLMNYNEIKCWITSIMAFRSWIGYPHTPSNTFWGVTPDCRCCTTEIIETDLTVRNSRLPFVDFQENFIEARSAVRDIVQEIEDFDPDLYYVPDMNNDLIDPEEAACAICHYVLDVEWTENIRLTGLTTKHLMKAEGLHLVKQWYRISNNSTIDFNDLRLLPIESIAMALRDVVIHEIMTRFPKATIETLGAILSSIPGEALPWVLLLDKLRLVNRMRELQTFMSSIARDTHKPCDSNVTYAKLFCLQCYKWWLIDPEVSRQVYLHTTRRDEIRDRRVIHRLNSIRYNQIYSILDDECRYASGLDLERETAIKVLCYAARSWRFLEDVRMETGVNGELVPAGLFCIVTDEMDVADLLSDMAEEEPAYLERWFDRYKKMKVREVFQELVDGEDSIYEDIERIDVEVRRQGLGYPIIIKKLDILSCKQAVQVYNISRPPHAELDESPRPLPDIRVRLGHTSFAAPDNVRQRLNDYADDNILDQLTLVQSRLYISLDNTIDSTTSMRPIGYCNISMSRYYWICKAIGLEHLGRSRYFVCLADGYGGSLSVLKDYLDYSKVLYVTAPTTSNELPLSMDHLLDNTTNVMDTYAVSVGRWDLRVKSNMEAFERDNPNSVHLCTCDAEVIGDNQDSEYESIWVNVSTFFLRNCTYNSIMIIKLKIISLIKIISLASWLRNYGMVYLVHSQASVLGTEIFLVLQVKEPNATLNYGEYKQKYPSNYNLNIYFRFFSRILRLKNDREARSGTCILRPAYDEVDRRVFRTLSCYGWSMLNSVACLALDSNFLIVRDNEDKNTHKQRVMNKFKVWRKVLEAGILDKREYDRGHVQHLYDTRTHQLVKLYKLILFNGFVYAWTEYFSGARDITAPKVEEGFYAERIKYNKIDPLLGSELGTQVVLLDKFDYNKAWLQGVRWGCSSVSWH